MTARRNAARVASEVGSPLGTEIGYAAKIAAHADSVIATSAKADGKPAKAAKPSLLGKLKQGCVAALPQRASLFRGEMVALIHRGSR